MERVELQEMKVTLALCRIARAQRKEEHPSPALEGEEDRFRPLNKRVCGADHMVLLSIGEGASEVPIHHTRRHAPCLPPDNQVMARVRHVGRGGQMVYIHRVIQQIAEPTG